MDTKRIDQVLGALDQLESNQEISIIRISEPITSSVPQDAGPRISDASQSSLEGPTPASLEADLSHYSELFSKLRFSYVEQVTKEKFIRAIVGDPPLIVTMQENLDMEKENAEAKAQLKSLKLEVKDMVEELEKKGRELSRRYENLQLEKTELRELPEKTRQLEDRIEELKLAQNRPGSDPTLNMPLTKTRDLVSRRKREQQDLARELESLQAKVPRKKKEVERLQAEMGPLEMKRQHGTAAAREAQRRKEAALGGVADDLEQRARWWRASEGVLEKALDIKA